LREIVFGDIERVFDLSLKKSKLNLSKQWLLEPHYLRQLGIFWNST